MRDSLVRALGTAPEPCPHSLGVLPPRKARFLLALLIPHELKEDYSAEMAEVYQCRVDSLGARQARVWYAFEVFKSILPLVWMRLRSLGCSRIMIRWLTDWKRR